MKVLGTNMAPFEKENGLVILIFHKHTSRCGASIITHAVRSPSNYMLAVETFGNRCIA